MTPPLFAKRVFPVGKAWITPCLKRCVCQSSIPGVVRLSCYGRRDGAYSYALRLSRQSPTASPAGRMQAITLTHNGTRMPPTLISTPNTSRSRWPTATIARKSVEIIVAGFMVRPLPL